MNPQVKTAFIFIDSFTTPQSHWYNWVRDVLLGHGYQVYIPSFPSSQKITYTAWKQTFEDFAPYVSDQSLFIGHGLGCAFLLRTLHGLSQPVRASILVAPVTQTVGNKVYDDRHRTFLAPPYDWALIQTKTRASIVIYGTDDPIIPDDFSYTLYRDALHAELVPIRHGGHLDTSTDRVMLPELATVIGIIENTHGGSSPDLAVREQLGGVDIPLEGNHLLDEMPDGTRRGLETLYSQLDSTMGTATPRQMSTILQKKRVEQEQEKEGVKKKTTNNMLVVGTVVLVILGALSLFMRKPTEQEIISVDTIPTLLELDRQGIAVLSQPTAGERIREILSTPPASHARGAIYGVVLQDIDKKILNARDALNSIGTRPPVNLVLGQDILVGFTNRGNNEPFIIVSLSSFNSAVTSMELWRDTLAVDLASFFDLVLPQTLEWRASWVDGYRIQGLYNTYAEAVPQTPIISPKSIGIPSVVVPPVEFTDISGGPLVTPVEKAPFIESIQKPLLFYTFLREDLLLIGTDSEIILDIVARARHAKNE